MSDIPRLIDLAKETGRVQFCLESNPTNYIGLSHLEHLFYEMRPPMLSVPFNIFTNMESVRVMGKGI
jgi:hypothetical protein